MAKKNSVLAAFGSNVRKAREKKELTQERLAEKADLDQTYISGIERGVAIRVCSALCASPRRLVPPPLNSAAGSRSHVSLFCCEILRGDTPRNPRQARTVWLVR
jgi:DNA-binding XRE family transcriptional regulator